MPWMIAPGLTPVFQPIKPGNDNVERSGFAYTLDSETWLYLAINPHVTTQKGLPLVVAHSKRKNRKANA